jgi:hypothetical protein
MKKTAYVLIALAVLLVIPAAFAQHSGMWVNVPFVFTVGENTLPAGEYFIEGLYWNAVAIHHGKGDKGIVLLAQKADRPVDATPKLVFRHYGTQYFLAEVVMPNMDSGRSFALGKEEIEVASSVDSLH